MIDTTHMMLRRYAKRMTQRDLGAEVGLTTDHICRLETGKMRPRLCTLIALCRALDTEPNKLIKGWKQ